MPDQQSEAARTRLFLALPLALACMGSASMVYYELAMFVPHMLESRASVGLGRGELYGNDFYPVWLTTRESGNGDRDLYGRDMTRKIQSGLFGRPLEQQNRTDPPTAYRQYAYPAFTNLLLWPSALLGFPCLRIALTLLFPVLTAISVWMWVKALSWDIRPIWLAALIIFTLGSHQLLEAFYALQPGLFVAFFLAGAALAIRSERLMLAGVLCSLTLMKPQVTGLALVYLLLWSFSDRGRARLWQGFTAIAVWLMAASLWIWPHWVTEWVAVLFGYQQYAPPPLVKVLLGSHVPNYVGDIIIAVLLVVGVAVAWANRHASPETDKFWFTVSLLLGITAIALLPEQAIYDETILVPGILILVRARPTARIPQVLWYVVAILLFWPFVAAFLLLIVRPVLSPAVLYAPVVNEVALPFAVLAMLLWKWKADHNLPTKLYGAEGE